MEAVKRFQSEEEYIVNKVNAPFPYLFLNNVTIYKTKIRYGNLMIKRVTKICRTQ